MQLSVDDGGGAADTAAHRQCLSGAVAGTGAAFHASVTIGDLHAPVAAPEDGVGADFQAPATTGAASRIQPQRGHAGQIAQVHLGLLQEIKISRRAIPPRKAIAMAGRAIAISFFTPDSDVKVVAPVKFKARNETTGANINTSALPRAGV